MEDGLVLTIMNDKKWSNYVLILIVVEDGLVHAVDDDIISFIAS